MLQLNLIVNVFICGYFLHSSTTLGGVVLPTKQLEDTRFWQNKAERQLHKVLTVVASESLIPEKLVAKNIIIFIGDGMGLPTVTATRIFKGQQEGKSGEEESLEFDAFPSIGLAKTYNVDKQVPDSAGTATALFTGVKTNYGVIGMDVVEAKLNQTLEKPRLTSIMDWAIAAKKSTGFVTTTRVTHATPAALYAHATSRDYECDTLLPKEKRNNTKDIARQLIEDMPGAGLNVIMGGGRQMLGVESDDPNIHKDLPKFDGQAEVECQRMDKRNLIDDWISGKFCNNSTLGRAYVQNRGELLNLKTEKVDYVLGLFSDNHMSYSSVEKSANDGPLGEPTLEEMVEAAIAILERNKEGFVLVVEGGRIDQAHHQNHARLALEEGLQMDFAIKTALRNTKAEDTLFIVTADHSHAMTLNGYPDRGNDILGFANKPNVAPYETLTYANGPGYWTHRANSADGKTWVRVDTLSDSERLAATYRHQAMLPLPDETHGGEDVPVYAFGAASQLIRGVFEQNYIAYAVSYAGCMGPAEDYNLICLHKKGYLNITIPAENATSNLIFDSNNASSLNLQKNGNRTKHLKSSAAFTSFSSIFFTIISTCALFAAGSAIVH